MELYRAPILNTRYLGGKEFMERWKKVANIEVSAPEAPDKYERFDYYSAFSEFAKNSVKIVENS